MSRIPAACPFCGAGVEAIAADRASAGCPQCGRAFAQDGNVVRWVASASAPRVGRRQWAPLLRDQLNPLTSRLSPLPYFTARRVEQFYRRAKSDRGLASDWASHYLSGVDLREGDCVLDHGCGRGRHAALLSQIDPVVRVCAQDVAAHPWWRELPAVSFQECPPEAPGLPWRSDTFALVLDVQVIHYLPPAVLRRHAEEVRRVLQPGGHWVLLEANDRSYGAFLPRRFCGRLHAVTEVRDLVRDLGFDVVDQWYEGFYAPVVPRLVNFVRKQAWPGPLDLSDYDSWLAAITPPERRAYWVLRARKVR